MKLGCILKFIAIVIVLLGTSFYLYEKYGEDFVSDTTEKAKELAIQKIEKLVDDFTEDTIKDPLKEKFAELLKDVENKKDQYSDEKFDEIINNFNKIVEENDFEEKTIEDLEKLIEVKK